MDPANHITPQILPSIHSSCLHKKMAVCIFNA